MNNSEGFNRGVLSSISFGHDKYLQMYLELQRITGISEQKKLLKWIDKFCDLAEKQFKMPTRKFNRTILSVKGAETALKFKEKQRQGN